jgi:hypothetical protein
MKKYLVKNKSLRFKINLFLFIKLLHTSVIQFIKCSQMIYGKKVYIFLCKYWLMYGLIELLSIVFIGILRLIYKYHHKCEVVHVL